MADVVLQAIKAAMQRLEYTTKISTAEQIRSYDTKYLPLVLISSIKRPTIGWVSTGQGGATRMYRMVLVQNNDLTVSKPLEQPSLEDTFKNDILKLFQGINYTTFANTPAWNSTVIDDDNFEAPKLVIAYSFSSILVVVDCLEVTTVG